MGYIIVAILGVFSGAISVFVLYESKRRRAEAQEQHAISQAEKTRLRQDALDLQADEISRMRRDTERDLNEKVEQLARLEAEFETRSVTYAELQEENVILKRDLQNIVVNLNKLELDRGERERIQATLDMRVRDLGRRHLQENVKWIGGSITPNNYVASKQRLLKVIAACRDIGLEISESEEAQLLDDLKQEYEKIVRAAFEREEQARIKKQIREEQRREREIERELQRLDREREAIRVALEKALAEAHDEHSAIVEQLRARLAEAEANKERALSQAQLTKSGHIYVISNVGAFGNGVFKIGMTRRLEPMDRVKELGDASVPFPFDVHMMISCDDAPRLENALHRALHKIRINKVNLRKEFFRTDVETIARLVEEHHGAVEYVADAEALEYNQTLSMAEEDVEFIEHVYDELADDGETVLSED